VFERSATDPSARGATGILRVLREQRLARGELGSNVWVAVGFGTAGVVCLLLASSGWFVDANQVFLAAGVLGLAALVLTYGNFVARHDRRTGKVELDELEQLAWQALVTWSSDASGTVSLEDVNWRTLKKLARGRPDAKQVEGFFVTGSR
jgi:hypothetical protein